MKRNEFFRPIWTLINEAVRNETAAAARQELRDLFNEIVEREEAYRRQLRAQMERDAAADLIALPAGSLVYFVGDGFADVRYGDVLTKVKDMRTRMRASKEGGKYFDYTIHYTALQKHAPTTTEWAWHNAKVAVDFDLVMDEYEKDLANN